MPKKLTSTRRQLVYNFLTLTSIFLLGIIMAYFFFNQSKQIRQFRNDLSRVHFQVTKIFNSELAFLLSEENDYQFHRTNESVVLATQFNRYNHLMSEIDSLLNNNKLFFEDFNDEITATKKHLIEHHQTFLTVIDMVSQRGFKDYGLVGKMREQIHQLEENPGNIRMADILMLRRHEKDFLLRDDSLYILKLNTLSNKLINNLEQQGADTAQVALIKDYQYYFNLLARVKHDIGGFLKNGKMLVLQQSIENIEQQLDFIELKARQSEEILLNRLRIAIFSIFSGLFMISVIMSIKLANLRAKPVKQLADSINQYDENSQDFSLNVSLPNASKELQGLLSSFNNLLRKLEHQFLVIEEKSATLEKQNKELKKVNEELDKFVYSVSHDLRAPLLSILGLINISKKENNVEKLHENLSLKEKSIKKLDSFIGDIIDLSRNARLETASEPIDWQELIEQVIEEQQFSLNFEKIYFERNINEKSVFFNDKRRLSVVLNNLVSNAIRYADLRKPDPTISINIQADENRAVIKVADNGIGIKEEHLSKIFNMFYRAHEYQVGSGLGLYICKETLEKMDGYITVTSTHGVGSTFMINLVSMKVKDLDTTTKSIQV